MPKQELKDILSVRRIIDANLSNLKDQVVSINRVTKVVKGGKNLSFSALVVVGDQKGHAGFGMGKAREVPMAIRKAIEQAKKNMVTLNLEGHHHPAPDFGALWIRPGAVEARVGRHGNHCRRSGACGDGSRGNSEYLDQVAGDIEPAQRDQGDF